MTMNATNSVNGYNPLSANTLFHFTQSFDTLLGILQHGFKPNYCLEDYTMFGLSECAVPMVCFCDIPLSQIRNHISTYGMYAIGLTKKWGIQKGISPILYTSSMSDSSTMLRQNLMMLHRGDTDAVHSYIKQAAVHPDPNNPGALLVESISRQTAFLAFTKLYEGTFWRNGRYLDREIRFYDEREWRYVPRFEETIRKDVENYIRKEVYLDPNQIADANSNLQNKFNLNFSPDDIRYIIVDNENELLSMVDNLSVIKHRFSEDQIKVVKTRIICMKQILDDF